MRQATTVKPSRRVTPPGRRVACGIGRMRTPRVRLWRDAHSREMGQRPFSGRKQWIADRYCQGRATEAGVLNYSPGAFVPVGVVLSEDASIERSREYRVSASCTRFV